MSASAGKVLLMPKGDYNSATAYSVLDWVRYQGASYVCKQASQGNLPTNTTYWSLLVQDGLSEDPNAYHTTDTAETTLADDDYVPFYDTSATAKRKTLWSNIKSVLKTYFDTLYNKITVTVTGDGTAAYNTAHVQNINIDSTAYAIDGTKYLETTTTSTPSTGTTRFTFTNAAISSNGVYDFYCDKYGVAPTSVTISSTTMYVDFNSSDSVTKCRVYIRG